jgi:hypothetical protein
MPSQRYLTFGAVLCAAVWAVRQVLPGPGYDPLAEAAAEKARGRIDNVLAHIPPQCYTRTGGNSNPCWTCHTAKNGRNAADDWELQGQYQFNAQGRVNHWTNLFVDRQPQMARISDAQALQYVRVDNYTPLRESLARVSTPDLRWKPDIDLLQGFDQQGFAKDGSEWRAFRYKPFPGTFWPTNGSVDEVFIRLPAEFRRDTEGRLSREVYRANLAIVEAAVAVPDTVSDDYLDYPIEPIEEAAAEIDLDGDGQIAGKAAVIRRLPSHYRGGASRQAVTRYDYPVGTEFLHTVHYLDPEVPGFRAIRLKELRYSRKLFRLDDVNLRYRYAEDAREQLTGGWPYFGGDAFTGIFNEYGWRLQGYIEDAEGRLRLQTREEQVYCMGCHSGIGVTVDGTFSLPRKVPGAAGWSPEDLAGIQDVPQAGSTEPEILLYFERVGGGDEFRANGEIRARYFPGNRLDSAAVRRAAPGGPDDIRSLVMPSAARALQLDKAYMALVREQSYKMGRDAPLAPLEQQVYRKVEEDETGLKAAGLVQRDGRLWLDWRSAEGMDTPLSPLISDR